MTPTENLIELLHRGASDAGRLEAPIDLAGVPNATARSYLDAVRKRVVDMLAAEDAAAIVAELRPKFEVMHKSLSARGMSPRANTQWRKTVENQKPVDSVRPDIDLAARQQAAEQQQPATPPSGLQMLVKGEHARELDVQARLRGA